MKQVKKMTDEIDVEIYGCHGCGEEITPRIIAGVKHCPECGSEDIVQLKIIYKCKTS